VAQRLVVVSLSGGKESAGLRTKAARLLATGVGCVSLHPGEAEAFARLDGFENAFSITDWFTVQCGNAALPFKGYYTRRSLCSAPDAAEYPA
jgi:hypothetical protein